MRAATAAAANVREVRQRIQELNRDLGHVVSLSALRCLTQQRSDKRLMLANADGNSRALKLISVVLVLLPLLLRARPLSLVVYSYFRTIRL